jgi:MoaA/NifB/PqqE/SkfB family radical SAM enzyme
MLYNVLFDRSIRSAVKTGIKLFRDSPQSRAALSRIMSSIPAAARRRKFLLKKGIAVPPLLIVSATERCNLSCAGCYAKSNCRSGETEMTRQQVDGLLAQAADAGCSIILIAGGEPLLCKDWLEGMASHPELLGLVFTNGTLLDKSLASWFADHRNLIPLFSVEGNETLTDERRGRGVTESVHRAMSLLSARFVPFGLSITTGEHNFREVAKRDFLLPFINLGCRLAIFSEYVPVDENDTLRALSKESKIALQNFCLHNGEKILLIPFPGDEEIFGGCLAAGRGFAHISASGNLEPCPFAAYSDANVLKMPLLDALASPLLKKIRNESHLLHEGEGGCALRGREAAFLET